VDEVILPENEEEAKDIGELVPEMDARRRQSGLLEPGGYRPD
jgi:hypothetical protein